MLAMPEAAQLRPRQRGTFPARVLDNRLICLDHYLLTVSMADFPPSRPGQFLQIQCGRADLAGAREVDWPAGAMPRLNQPELAGRQPLLRRPFSIAGRADRADGLAAVEVIHHVIGVGTAWLAQLKAGAELNVLGPLGNGFALRGDRPMAALVGGGVGIPPLLYLAEALAREGKETVAFAGARTGRALPLTTDPAEPPSQAGWPTLCAAEFAARSCSTVVATDDGSLGFAGMVSEAFALWLGQRRPGPEELVVYACGPPPMLQAVAGVCLPARIECQLALERHMACGMGTCQSCVVRVRSGRTSGWQYKLACTDGPVFDARELIWQGPEAEVR